jgi:hypothetical protein
MWHTPKSAAFVAALMGLLLAPSAFVRAQGDTNRVSMPFSDPSRPGTVRVNLFQGSIKVTASTGREVVVTTDETIVTRRDGREAVVPPRPEAIGLRRLTQPSGLQITEENNVMSISSGRFMGGEDLVIEVPVRTNLNLSAFNDEIEVEGVNGEIEVTSMNGEIDLRNVSGAVVAHATNGEVRVSLRQLTADKPMAFTSLNGDVDVTLPASARANLRLRSDQGEVYTDFDVQIQQARPGPTPGQAKVAPAPPRPPLPPLPPLPPGSSSKREAEQRERARRELERQSRELERRNRMLDDTAIYGAINGGGPEFELRTFNGDVFLRRGK